MLSVGRLLVSTAEMAEAEGRVLRRHVVELARAAALGLLALFLAMTGIYLILIGTYRFLAARYGDLTAGAILGVVAFIVAGGLVWMAKNSIKKMNPPKPSPTTVAN